MKKTIGLLAHVDAGKTTLAEELLYITNSIRIRGRVDHKNAFLDNNNIERERGITIFSEQGVFEYKEDTYYLMDTPGHVDFSPEMERAMQIMDYAIIIISGVEGIEAHTETVWRLLRKHQIPTFFFINKIDREGSDDKRVLKEIRAKFTEDVCFIDRELSNEEMSEELIEFIAERDESLLHKYLEGGYKEGLWLSSMKIMIKENRIFPCHSGSALQHIGIEKFIKNLHELTYTEYSDAGEFRGRVFKIRHDENGGRITYIKAIKGNLRVKEELTYGCEDNRGCEKINQIRIYNGSKFKTEDKISAGEIFAVTGLSTAIAGDGVGELNERINYELIPTLKSKVIFPRNINVKEVLGYFKILEAENPILNVAWDERLQEIQVQIMGVIQLQVLKDIIEERFNLSVEFGSCEILYKETIRSQVVGYGHFEPLKHYAEVHLKLEPMERNSGIIFESECHSDNLTNGNQNLVRTHIYEREHRGILAGFPLTDVKITLLTGRSHNKHTSGGDFREATIRALRQGLEKSENVILEPYYQFRIEVELDYMGRVLSDIQRFNGTFEAPENFGDKVIIKGRGPVATFMNYSMEFISFTKGKGILSFIFQGYDYCHNEEEIIKKIGYNKNADPEYTSSSIFCSKGQGFIVEWDRVEEYMHCLE